MAKKAARKSVRRNSTSKKITRSPAQKQKAQARTRVTSKSLTTRKSKKGRPSQKKPSSKSVKRNDFIAIKRKYLPPPALEKETPVPLYNLEREVLAGVLHEPACATDTLVIAVHGMTGTKNEPVIKHTCIELARAGYAAYRVDLSGNGDSEGRFEDMTVPKMLKDISAVVEHFRRQYQKIILLGHSVGGMLAVMAGARMHLQGVIAIAPLAQSELYEKRFAEQQLKQLRSVGFAIVTRKRPVGEIPYTFTEALVRSIMISQPLRAAADVHCPALLVQGTADASVPPINTELYAEALFKRDIALIGGADHDFVNPQHLESLIHTIICWMQKRF